MVVTSVPKNTLKRQDSDLSHARTVVHSDQRRIFLVSRFNSPISRLASRVPVSAAHSQTWVWRVVCAVQLFILPQGMLNFAFIIFTAKISYRFIRLLYCITEMWMSLYCGFLCPWCCKTSWHSYRSRSLSPCSHTCQARSISSGSRGSPHCLCFNYGCWIWTFALAVNGSMQHSGLYWPANTR